MAKIRVTNKDTLQFQIEKAIAKKMDLVFAGAQELLQKQAQVYRDKFANSQEYQEIKSKMVGEFGFTPAEVAGLDRILELLVPGGNEITISFVDTVNRTKFMILEWVDFSKLKEHPLAQHELTKLNELGNVIGVTDVVSWVEWLENGETFHGFEFFRPNAANAARSRSGAGLMRRDSGGVFMLEPTRVFERIGNEADIDVLRKGFGLLVKKFGRA